MRDGVARTVVLAALGRLRTGRLSLGDAGGRVDFGEPAATAALTAAVTVHSSAVYPAMLRRGGRGLAQAYADGLWDCDDLVALVRIASRAMTGLDPWRSRAAALGAPVERLLAARRSNTRERSRSNVERHYDLGNEFFALVLDQTMGYSCAYWERPGMTAVEASRANLDRVCRMLDLRPTDRLLELGSGWGGLALHAATRYGCRVSTVTISPSQRAYIDALAAERGVGHLVEVVLSDYRDLRGSWDKLVSLEMIESVGAHHLDDFVTQWGRLLDDGGLAVIQAITTSDRLFRIDRYRRTFLNQLIFPGGCVPSVEAVLQSVASHTALRAVAVHDITPHYPPTLRAWRERLAENWPRILALGGFDEPFRRLWTLYFSWCEAAFLERRVLDRQMILAGPRWRDENRLLGAGAAEAEPAAERVSAAQG